MIPLTAIVCTFIVIMRVIGLKKASARRQHDVRGRQLDELQARIDACNRTARSLEDRIRVLERIVTDDAGSLRNEIERLRA